MKIDWLNHEFEKMIGDSGIKVPGLGVIIYKDGKEIYSKFLGSRVIETAKPVTRQTRFRAASVSKMFTVFSIMQLVEQNKINLDEDASKYLGFGLRNPNYPQKKITVRMLASHTSSLRDGKIYSIPPNISLNEFFATGNHFATEPPETFFTYCNLNYGVLGTIIEVVSGKRFDIYQRENILSQLDMKADYLPSNLDSREFEMLGTIYQKKNPQGIWNEFGDWYAQIDDYKVQPPKDIFQLQNPYDENFQPAYSLKDYRVGTNATIFSPQGGLRISFEELTHVLELLINNGIYRGRKVLSKSSLDTMVKSHWTFNGKNGDTCSGAILSYGLGLYFIDGNSSSRMCKDYAVNLIGHTGQAFGLLAGLFFIPNSKTGFIYMLNGEALAEGTDPRSLGQFSGNYIWEEKIMNTAIAGLLKI